MPCCSLCCSSADASVSFLHLPLWSLFSISSSAVFFFLYRFASPHTYALSYWAMETADALLQLAVIAEVAGHCLPAGARK